MEWVVGAPPDVSRSGCAVTRSLPSVPGVPRVNAFQAYPQLWMALSGEMLSPKRALCRLEKHFSRGDPSREFVVLLVDELDYMVSPPPARLAGLRRLDGCVCLGGGSVGDQARGEGGGGRRRFEGGGPGSVGPIGFVDVFAT